MPSPAPGARARKHTHTHTLVCDFNNRQATLGVVLLLIIAIMVCLAKLHKNRQKYLKDHLKQMEDAILEAGGKRGRVSARAALLVRATDLVAHACSVQNGICFESLWL